MNWLTPATARVALMLAILAAPPATRAQHADRTDHGARVSGAPVLPGQDAFGAIAEVVRILESDSTTDWSRVSIARLREHLIDMRDVALDATAVQVAIPGGARMDVAGGGRTRDAIRRLLRAHVTAIAHSTTYRASYADTPDGGRLTVIAAEPSDTRTAAKIRALGFIGFVALENHHPAHHLALARGETGH